MFRLVLAVASIVFSLSANASIDCKSNIIHPKSVAECALKAHVNNGIHLEINQQVKYYELQKMRPSQEYNALFIGAKKTEKGFNWTYLVGVDFSNESEYRTLTAVIRVYTYPTITTEVVEVLSLSRIDNLLK